jgi:Phage integrase family
MGRGSAFSHMKRRLQLHDLRHTFGTLAVRTYPLSDVRAYMGHADIATTMIYVHNTPQHDAADRLSELIDGEVGCTPGARSETAAEHESEESGAEQEDSEWAGEDSGLRPTDYESARGSSAAFACSSFPLLIGGSAISTGAPFAAV